MIFEFLGGNIIKQKSSHMYHFITSIHLIACLLLSASYPQQGIDKGFKVDDLPEYVVIRSEGLKESWGKTLFLGIDSRRSTHEKALVALEDYLSNKDKRAVNSQTDLLNAMSELGFDYLNAYQIGTEDMVNVVFRKQEQYRK